MTAKQTVGQKLVAQHRLLAGNDGHFSAFDLAALAAAIDRAAQEQIEKDAGMADAKGKEWGDLSMELQRDGDYDTAKIRMGWALGADAIAAAIRSQGETK